MLNKNGKEDEVFSGLRVKSRRILKPEDILVGPMGITIFYAAYPFLRI